MVAEKPSLAQSLAKILARGSQVNSRKGFNGACSVHEFVTKFPPTNETARFKFTSVCGHVMSLDFLGRYNNWDKVDPVSSRSCFSECVLVSVGLRIHWHRSADNYYFFLSLSRTVVYFE